MTNKTKDPVAHLQELKRQAHAQPSGHPAWTQYLAALQSSFESDDLIPKQLILEKIEQKTIYTRSAIKNATIDALLSNVVNATVSQAMHELEDMINTPPEVPCERCGRELRDAPGGGVECACGYTFCY